MTIRAATRGDLPEIKNLALAAWLHAYRDIISEDEIRRENAQFYSPEWHDAILYRCDQKLHVFNLLFDGGLIGLIDFDFAERHNWLMRFYLAPEFIGRGLGTLLMRHSEQELYSLGKDSYYLRVHEKNALGRRFYERRGYVRFERYDDFESQELCYFRSIDATGFDQPERRAAQSSH